VIKAIYDLRIMLRASQYVRSNRNLTEDQLIEKIKHLENSNIDPKQLTLN
jgi:hypothetical protein